MYLSIITLPLLGSIISGFFGRKVGFTGSQFITCTFIITITLFSTIAFSEVGLDDTQVNIKLFRWIDSESHNIL